MGVTRMSIGEWPGKIVTIDLEGECEQLGEWMGVTSMSIGKTVLKVKVKAKNMRTTGSRQDWSWKQTWAMMESDDDGSQTWKACWAHNKEKKAKKILVDIDWWWVIKLYPELSHQTVELQSHLCSPNSAVSWKVVNTSSGQATIQKCSWRWLRISTLSDMICHYHIFMHIFND